VHDTGAVASSIDFVTPITGFNILPLQNVASHKFSTRESQVIFVIGHSASYAHVLANSSLVQRNWIDRMAKASRDSGGIFYIHDQYS
jgi:hypothetical protein